MAIIPVEIITIGDVPTVEIEQVINTANIIQSGFSFKFMEQNDAKVFKVLSFQNTTVQNLFDSIGNLRKQIRGYHPFIIAVVDSRLEGKRYSNLFGSNSAEEGIAVFTIADIENIIIPKDKMAAYYLYYFARFPLSFLAPKHKNHEVTKDCVFDRKVNKLDFVKSMKRNAICDECRNTLVNTENQLTSIQFDALSALFELSGEIFHGLSLPQKIISHLSRDQVYRHIFSLCQTDSLFGIADFGDKLEDEDYERIVLSDATALRHGANHAVIGSIRLLPYGTGTVVVFVNNDVIWHSEITESGRKLFNLFIERAKLYFCELENLDMPLEKPTDAKEGKNEGKMNREMIFKVIVSIMVLGFALAGFALLSWSSALLWLIFLIVAYPVSLAFTFAKQSIDNHSLVEIYKAGVSQIPLLGKLFAKKQLP
jgi:hypothetical protein